MPTASTERAPAAPRRSASGLRGRKSGRSLGTLLLAALTTLTAGTSTAEPPSRADPNDPDRVARGEQIYAEACASCHGARLEGQPDWRSPQPDGTFPAPPHDAEGHTWHHADSLLFRYTKLGGAEALKDVPGFRSGMPGFSETLSDREIWDVLAFIKLHWPEEMRDYQREVTENDQRD